MKSRVYRIVTALGLAIFNFSVVVVQAQDYSYTINNGTITITKYTGPGGVVTIPGTINELPVTSIGDYAFYRCSSLTSITIPNSVTGICVGAFQSCGLTNVTIPASVSSIGGGAFSWCLSLKEITVDALNPNYSSMDGVLFNKSHTSIIQCPGGRTGSYTIPDSVTSIGDSSFDGCTSLTSVTIPDSVTSIGDGAFSYCTSLTSVTIPDSVTSIGEMAFDGCSSLTASPLLAQTGRVKLSLKGEWPGYPCGSGWDMVISGKHAYCALVDGGLMILDVSNPANPQKRGAISTSGYALGVSVSGNYAYVAAFYAGLQVIDISNPANPLPVGRIITRGETHDVAVSGNYAYVAEWGRLDGTNYLDGGLEVMDISDPANPQRVGGYDKGGGGASGLIVSGNYAYVAGFRLLGDGTVSGNWVADMEVIDISNPTNPKRVGAYATSGRAFDVAVSGKYAYVTWRWGDSDIWQSGLQVIDISNPANPQPVDRIITSGDGEPMKVALSGDFAFVTDYAGLQVIDISKPASLKLVGGINTGHGSLGVALSGNYCYVGADSSSLQVIDVSNPSDPQQVAGFALNIDGMAASGNHAYVLCTRGLQVIDLSNPANPQRVGWYQTSGSVWCVAVSGDYAYLATGNQLQIIDVRDASAPTLKGLYGDGNVSNGNRTSLRLTGNTLFVSAGFCGPDMNASGPATNRIDSVDVTDPVHPVKVGTYMSLNPVGDWGFKFSPMETDGNRLYYGYWVQTDEKWCPGIGILDASNPAQLKALGSLNLDGGPVGSIVPLGNYLYVTTAGGDIGWGAVHIIDISDPAHPRLARRIGNNECATVLGVSCPQYIVRNGDYAFLSGEDPRFEPDGSDKAALAVLDVRHPEQPVVVGRTYSQDISWRSRVLTITGNRLLWCDSFNVAVYEVSDLPVFTHQSIENGNLNLQWNQPAKGMKLQRTTSLTNPVWQDLLGSENTNAVFLPIWGGSEFFRLAK